jgi:hypothetical protein
MASSLLVLPFSFSLANHRGHWRSGAWYSLGQLVLIPCPVSNAMGCVEYSVRSNFMHFLRSWSTLFVDTVAQDCVLLCADSCVVIVDIYDLWPSWPASHICHHKCAERVSSLIPHCRVASLLSPGRIAVVRAALTAAGTVTECHIAVSINTKLRRMSANQVFWICDMLRLLSSNRAV